MIFLLRCASATAANDEFAHDTHLPLLHLVLLVAVLLEQLVEHLAQAVGVGLQRRHHVLHRALHQHAVDHPEALALSRQRLQRLENQSVCEGHGQR